MTESDYLLDEAYMAYKRNIYKKKRIFEIITIILFVIGTSLIITGIVFHFMNNDISFIFFVIGFSLVLLSAFYMGMARIVYNDDVLYNRYIKKNK